MQSIKKQSGFSVFYDNELLKESKPVSIEVKNAALRPTLNLIFANQPLVYEIVGSKVISIKRKEKAENTLPPAAPATDTVRGTVRDEEGKPMPGTTVSVKGTSNHTITDADGRYRILVNNKPATLQFSYVGFMPQERPVAGNGQLDVTLTPNISRLDDIVVIGYGTRKREDLTGSVASVSGEQLEKNTNISLNQALQGRAAGVQVVSNDGAPGAEVNISIRGGSSISASNEPLYVIDGFPQFGGSNLNLSSNDIASIEILKDASATAIYGSRGANGVVIITTKSAKSGKFTISYNPVFSFQRIVKKLPVINALQFAEAQHFRLSTPEGSGSDVSFANWATYKDSTSVNWQDVVYRTGWQQTHNLSFTGGTNDVKVSGSFSFLDQKGIAVGTNFTRYTGRLNTIVNVTRKITSSTNIYLANTEHTGPSVTGETGIGQGVLRASPFVTNDNLDAFLNQELIGQAGTSNSISNPLLELTTVRIARRMFTGLINSFLSFELSKNLTLKVSGGLNYNQQISNSFYPTTTNIGRLYNGYAQHTSINTIDWINENTVTYNKRFAGRHNTSTVVGFTTQNNILTRNTSGAQDFPIQSMGADNLSLGRTIHTPTSFKQNAGLQSFLGRINYDYAGKYYLTVSYRADGSSKFMRNKWGFFPSAGGSWKLSEEPFMKRYHDILSLKLRASWGITGNQSVTPYSSFTTYGSSNVVVNEGWGVGMAPLQIGNEDLRWETNTQTNLGIDIGLFKNRVTITADVYRKLSKDLLLNAPISLYSGYTSVYRNVGNAQVQGLEANLNTVNLDGKFRWVSNFNISLIRSKVLSLTEGQDFITLGTLGRRAEQYIVKKGEALGAIYGFIFDGIFNTQEELAAGPLQPGVSILGGKKYKDVNGPKGVPDGQIDNYDRTIIGNGNPDFFGGISNTLSYKGFDLDILFTYSYGNKLLNSGKAEMERPGILQGGLAVMMNRWTPETPYVNMPKWGAQVTEVDVNTSYLVEDGSYFRLKTLMLNYSFSGNFLKRTFLKELKTFVSAENLFTFTKYSGYDPEVNYFNSIITPGADLYNYPRARTYTIGIKSTF
ncbi:TonB-dependent receptor [Chitinophaga niabensis]|uniref:TonB-dependent receptor n=1 Tax=Chitinophaga niabensis TaxID=536979 RepID=UPI0031BB1F40